jgi:hypothetical protein
MSETDKYTFTQLYELVEDNGVYIDSSMLSKNALLTAIREHNIVIPDSDVNEVKWEPERGRYKIYHLVITRPVRFNIVEGDIIVFADKKRYMVTSIDAEDEEEDTCTVQLEDMDTLEIKTISAAELIKIVDETNMIYEKNKWIEFMCEVMQKQKQTKMKWQQFINGLQAKRP